MTVNEAAEKLGITPARVRALIASGRLKAKRHGQRAWEINAIDLRAVRHRKNGRPKKKTIALRNK